MIKESNFKKIKNKIVCFIVALGLAISAFAGLSISNKSTVLAYNENLTSSLINDSTFTSYSGNAPYTPSNWTRISNQGNYNSETMASGIFNSDNTTEKYLKQYKVLSNPGVPTTDQTISSSSQYYYSLAMSAPYNAGGNFGYQQATSSLSLSKNSFYAMDVVLKTINSDNSENSDINNLGYSKNFDSRASIYLTGFSTEPKNSSFEMIESQYGKPLNDGWGVYTFYIATNEFTAEKDLNIQLWLGSKTQVTTGTVFFNQIILNQLDHNTFENSIQGIENASYKCLVDLRDESSMVTYPVSSPTFEKNWSLDWDAIEYDTQKAVVSNVNVYSFKNNAEYKKANLTTSDLSDKNLMSADNDVLFMANCEETYTVLQNKENINIARQSYYKLSLWAWSNSRNSTAPSIKLVNTTEDRTLETATISVSTSSSKYSTATNGWVEYSFYIYGDPYIDTTCKIQIVIGSDSEKAKGYVYIDDISMKQISYSQYTNGVSESNSAQFNYNTAEENYLVSNHDFNITENSNKDNKYPLTPSGWTYNESFNAQNVSTNGVINTKSTLFNLADLSISSSNAGYNPGTLPDLDEDANNNVLMMGSRFKGLQSYTSASFGLTTADSYYAISFFVNAKNGGAGIKIANTNGYLVDMSNIKTSGWTKFTTYVKINSTETDYKIIFSLNNDSNDAKYAFFDDVIVESVEKSVYTGAVANQFVPETFGSEYITKIDHTNYDFENDNLNNSANGFTESASVNGTYIKVANTSENLGQVAHSGNNALIVYSNNVNNGKYYAKTNRSFSLSASKYYKISMFVKTTNIEGTGAFIGISGNNVDETISEIISNNGWTEYSFYINAKSASDITLNLGLCDDTSGYALFDDISITPLTCENEDDFNALTTNLDKDIYKKLTVETSSTDDSTNTNDKTDNEFKASFDWYLVTALVTALAIIIAVVGVCIRKVNWKKSKKIKNSYDRAKTLDKDVNRRERIARRQQQISELEKQLQEIEDEIAKIKLEAEQQEKARKEENDRIRAEIESRKQAHKEEREKALRERNEKIAKDKNAFTAKEEEEFSNYIRKLEKIEQKEQFELNKHDKKVNAFKDKTEERIAKYIARQEYIKAEIARIDAEIEEIAREEAEVWEEYKKAKAEAKQRKAEYKASLKEQKANKSDNTNSKKSDK